MARIKVGVVGYGTIGKRVADAVSKQDDMELIGIACHGFDWRYKMALERGYALYKSEGAREEEFKENNVELAGDFEEFLRDVDVVVDCSPKGVGEKHKPLYEKAGVKAVFEGGEKHEVAGVSFNANRNYEESLNKQFTRVVSCNTTALARVVGALEENIGIKKAYIALVRRAVDPIDSHKKGIMNTVVPELAIPSHQAEDLKKIIKGLDITTIAVKASHNMMHLHIAFIELKRESNREEVIDILDKERRVLLIKKEDKVFGLNSLFELGRDLGRERGDIYEIPVWEESSKAEGDRVYMMWATPNESNVIPDNIDAIRALFGIEKEKSLDKTDKSLGIKNRI